MEPPQGSHSQLAFFPNDTYWRPTRLSIFSQSWTGECRLRHRHFCRDFFGHRHGRYPASSAPHRTAEPRNLAFSFGRVERELVSEAPCFLVTDRALFSFIFMAAEEFVFKSCICGPGDWLGPEGYLQELVGSRTIEHDFLGR